MSYDKSTVLQVIYPTILVFSSEKEIIGRTEPANHLGSINLIAETEEGQATSL
jgi:hypothetical protein